MGNSQLKTGDMKNEMRENGGMSLGEKGEEYEKVTFLEEEQIALTFSRGVKKADNQSYRTPSGLPLR